MAHDRVSRHAVERLPGGVNRQQRFDRFPRNSFGMFIEKIAIERRHPVGILVGLPPEHHAIDVIEMGTNFR